MIQKDLHEGWYFYINLYHLGAILVVKFWTKNQAPCCAKFTGYSNMRKEMLFSTLSK